MKRMMRRICLASALIAVSALQVAVARPWPAQTGISATADTAATAGNNPAGMVRFDARANRVELLAFFSDNTWEGQLGNGPTFTSDDSGESFAPLGSFVRPINEDWYFGFTVLGSAFSEDFGSDWVGRYFIQEYDLINLNAFPSIAYKINEQWSVAASLSVQYTTYEQTKAVPNDPGLPDGQLTVDADGFAAGFATSAMYQLSDKTRFGLTYRSEIDADIDGNGNFSGLGPITESLLDMAGLLGAKVNITSRTPQGVTVGAYHEFDDGGAIAVDVVWIDFSRFVLSEIFVNGDQIVENSIKYDDIWAISLGYTRPISERWAVGIGGFLVDDMVDDENRTLTLRLDDIWALGVGVEWHWTETRSLFGTFNYIQLGDAPVTSPDIPGIGAVTGVYSDRGTVFLQAGMNFGPGAK